MREGDVSVIDLQETDVLYKQMADLFEDLGLECQPLEIHPGQWIAARDYRDNRVRWVRYEFDQWGESFELWAPQGGGGSVYGL